MPPLHPAGAFLFLLRASPVFTSALEIKNAAITSQAAFIRVVLELFPK
jgi:hypothetical protein